METVHNVAEAEKFFSENSAGQCTCENENKVTKIVDSFAEAQEFFGGESTDETVEDTTKDESTTEDQAESTSTENAGAGDAENVG